MTSFGLTFTSFLIAWFAPLDSRFPAPARSSVSGPGQAARPVPIEDSALPPGPCSPHRELVAPEDGLVGHPPGGTARVGAALHWAGDRLLVGASHWSSHVPRSGAVLYRSRAGALSVLAEGLEPFAHFGSSLTSGRDWLAVGAPLSDAGGVHAGAVHVFPLPGFIMGGEPLDPSRALLLTPGQPSLLAGFGSSLAGEGESLAVGAPRTRGALGSYQVGTVHLFHGLSEPGPSQPGTSSAVEQQLRPPQEHSGARFGASLALSSPFLAVGAPGWGDRGAVFVYRIGGGDPVLLDRVSPSDLPLHACFGEAVTISGSWLVVGAPGPEGGGQAGAVHFFSLDEFGCRPSGKAPSWSPQLQEFGAVLEATETGVLASARGPQAGVAHLRRVEGEVQLQVLAAPALSGGLGVALAASTQGLAWSEVPSLPEDPLDPRSAGIVHLLRAATASRRLDAAGGTWRLVRWSDGEAAVLGEALPAEPQAILSFSTLGHTNRVRLSSPIDGQVLWSSWRPGLGDVPGRLLLETGGLLAGLNW